MDLHEALAGFGLLDGVDEHVEEALHVRRSSSVLGMELDAEMWKTVKQRVYEVKHGWITRC